MAKIEVDGQVYNAMDTCQAPFCPRPSAARMIEPENPESKRRDLCFRHAAQMIRVYKDAVEIIAVWNGYTMEDFS